MKSNIDWPRFLIAITVVWLIGTTASTLMLQAGIDTPWRILVCFIIGILAAVVYPLPMKNDN